MGRTSAPGTKQAPPPKRILIETHQKPALDDDDKTTQPNAAKMKYIHSQQELTVPEGGMFANSPASLKSGTTFKYDLKSKACDDNTPELTHTFQ